MYQELKMAAIRVSQYCSIVKQCRIYAPLTATHICRNTFYNYMSVCVCTVKSQPQKRTNKQKHTKAVRTRYNYKGVHVYVHEQTPLCWIQAGTSHNIQSWSVAFISYNLIAINTLTLKRRSQNTRRANHKQFQNRTRIL